MAAVKTLAELSAAGHSTTPSLEFPVRKTGMALTVSHPGHWRAPLPSYSGALSEPRSFKTSLGHTARRPSQKKTKRDGGRAGEALCTRKRLENVKCCAKAGGRSQAAGRGFRAPGWRPSSVFRVTSPLNFGCLNSGRGGAAGAGSAGTPQDRARA